MKHTQQITVVYIITTLELGGAQKICLSLFKGIDNKHLNSWLITSKEGELHKTIVGKKNTIVLDALQRNISYRGILQEVHCFLQLITQLRRLKKEHPYILVHTHSTKAGILGRWAALFAGIKHRIHTIHGYAFHPYQSTLHWYAIYVCELLTSLITTHFICVSSHDVQTGTRLFPRFTKKYSIIRAAVAQEDFFLPQYQRLTPSFLFVFGTVACFKKQKNIFDLLQAFEYVHMHNQTAYLEIIGDGTLRTDIEAWIKQRSLQKNIILHGWQQQVAPIMKTWHSFVLSSLWEGLPCAIIEARLLHLPVLSYNTGGISDVIIDGQNGFLYNQGDWQSLAQGMIQLTHDTTLYNKLCNYKDNLDEFDHHYMIEQHSILYKTIIQTK